MLPWKNMGLAAKKKRLEDIYNPWSILNYLDKRKASAYWANTSSNNLITKLLQESSRHVKELFEALLRKETIACAIDEQIVYNKLDRNESAIWSLLLASGYLKVVDYEQEEQIPDGRAPIYQLALTNHEVERMFYGMVREWFAGVEADYNDFVKALLLGDLKTMNLYMNRVSQSTFSHFDTGKRPSKAMEPERFYHGFVLGLLVELTGRYLITSNRESGFGRYDVLLEPLKDKGDAFILEFKVQDVSEEASLQETVNAALLQIETKKYDIVLLDKGIPENRIHKYGFAFQGKRVLIGTI